MNPCRSLPEWWTFPRKPPSRGEDLVTGRHVTKITVWRMGTRDTLKPIPCATPAPPRCFMSKALRDQAVRTGATMGARRLGFSLRRSWASEDMQDEIDVLLDQLAIILERVHRKDGDVVELVKEHARIMARIDVLRSERKPRSGGEEHGRVDQAEERWLN
jgi:hypothetical protein